MNIDQLGSIVPVVDQQAEHATGAHGLELGIVADQQHLRPCLLHATALDARKPADLFRWTLDPAAAAEAVAILINHSDATAGWADSLGTMIDAGPKSRDSIW